MMQQKPKPIGPMGMTLSPQLHMKVKEIQAHHAVHTPEEAVARAISDHHARLGEDDASASESESESASGSESGSASDSGSGSASYSKVSTTKLKGGKPNPVDGAAVRKALKNRR